MDEIQRGKGEELAILLADADGEITPEQIRAWEDYDLEEWLNLQGYEWSEEFEEWLLTDE